LRDQARVVGRSRQRRLGVSAVADDQRNPLFLLLRGSGTQDPREPGNEDQAKRKNRKSFDHTHGFSACSRFNCDIRA